MNSVNPVSLVFVHQQESKFFLLKYFTISDSTAVISSMRMHVQSNHAIKHTEILIQGIKKNMFSQIRIKCVRRRAYFILNCLLPANSK